jgi:DNA modification methylase
MFDGEWFLHNGDCMEHMATMPEASVDFAVYSPPFPSVYAYTSSPADLGNSEDRSEYKLHFSFFFRAVRRILKPGRVMIVHCTQIQRMKRIGGQGTYDFRGLLIRLGERAGFVFDYDWCIRKNPQSQAIRTKSHSLQFAGLEADRAKSRGAMPDFLLKFLVPGENANPIDEEGQVSRNDWIEWAENCWRDIKETDTLNTKSAKGPEDTKHICPLQLQVINRLVHLYSDPGEIVFSPFAGIGSEGYIAVKNDRRFYGCELKQEYYAAACRNLAKASVENKLDNRTLFSGMGVS